MIVGPLTFAVGSLNSAPAISATTSGPQSLDLDLASDALGTETTVRVIGLKLVGLERTDPAWLEHYIGYAFPRTMSPSDLAWIERKLLTTAVFTQVSTTLEASDKPADERGKEYWLKIAVTEKWTTIPVVRGVYGGGTPLRVLGMYDIHTFGRLLTFGGEARKYGDAPPGVVAYFRDARADGDRYYLGAEFWREFRRRDLYDRSHGGLYAHVSSNQSLARLRLLRPLEATDTQANNQSAPGGSRRAEVHWKGGADLDAVFEAPSVLDAAPGGEANAAWPATASSLGIPRERREQVKILPTVLFDDVHTNQLLYEGLRIKAKTGPIFVQKSDGIGIYGATEVEGFYYQALPHATNFAARGLVGAANFASLQSQYFLGGLDTIRGLPDGAIYGTHATYANLELRHLAAKYTYLWIQPTAFWDVGGAGADWTHVGGEGARSTMGVGVRLAVPQVYRLIFRLDYGWSIIGPRTQGITAGMNQFFDPYIPL